MIVMVNSASSVALYVFLSSHSLFGYSTVGALQYKLRNISHEQSNENTIKPCVLAYLALL